MTVATFVQPNFNTQDPTTYKGSIDACFAVARQIAAMFAPHQASTPNMTVVIDAGSVFNGTTLTSVAQQTTSTITAPATNPRIDRIVIDRITGVYQRVAGTEAGSPTPPAIPAGKHPVCQILLQPSSTSITNSMITDERNLWGLGGGINLDSNDLASASTCDLGSVGSNFVNVTGTTTITSLGSSASTGNPLYFVTFASDLTLTHNGTSLILPGAANIVTAAGDAGWFEYLGSGNWRCRMFYPANGRALVEPDGPATLNNFTLALSVGANALTVAIKDKAGNDPTAISPVRISFRNATAGSGDYTVLTLTSATSFTVSSGSTLGAANNVPFRLWVVGFNDGGTFRLGLINCLTSSGIVPLDEGSLKSSSAEGGSGGADSAGTIYTGSAVSTKPFRILGYLEWGSGLSTAGAWASAPDMVQLFGPGIARPGTVLQTQQVIKTDTFSTASGTPVDVTGLSISITPSSKANQVLATANLCVGNKSNTITFCKLVRGSTSIGIGDAASNRARDGAGCFTDDDGLGSIALNVLDSPQANTSTTYKVQMRTFTATSGTSYLNRSDVDTDNASYGRGASTLQVMEIMG